MPTPAENIEIVSAFANEVFGNKNLEHAEEWLADDFIEHQVFPGTTPDKRGAIDSYRIFFEAVPDMKAEIHDVVAAGDRVALRRRTAARTKAGSSRARPQQASTSRWRRCTSSG